MIKPESLWGLFKTCEDSKWLGDICRALGRQEVKLDFGQEQMFKTIYQDSGWMDERIEDQRKRWSERQRKSRTSKSKKEEPADVPPVTLVTQCHSDIDVSRDVTIHPTIQPSIQPSINNNMCVCDTRTRPDVPSLEEVVNISTNVMGVPEWYAKWWWGNQESSGWVKTNGQRIDNINWRAVLRAWWNRAGEEEKNRIKTETTSQKKENRPRSFSQEDWVLCQERCAEFSEGRCRCGKVVPPQYRPRPCPPEECDLFKELSK